MGALIIVLALVAVLMGFLAWPAMLVLGSIHAAWPTMVPALGFWHTWASLMVIKLVNLF